VKPAVVGPDLITVSIERRWPIGGAARLWNVGDCVMLRLRDGVGGDKGGDVEATPSMTGFAECERAGSLRCGFGSEEAPLPLSMERGDDNGEEKLYDGD